MLGTFYYNSFFLGEITDLQALPQRVVLCYPAKKFNKVNRFSEVPNTL